MQVYAGWGERREQVLMIGQPGTGKNAPMFISHRT